MRAKTFADFFGAIDFQIQSKPGNFMRDDPDAEPFNLQTARNRARNYRREIDKTADYLNRMGGSDRAVATHNARAAAMALEIAKEWAMRKHDERYCFK